MPLHELGRRPLRLEGHRLLGEQQAPILPRSPNLIELAKFSRQAAKRSAASSRAQILAANHAVLVLAVGEMRCYRQVEARIATFKELSK